MTTLIEARDSGYGTLLRNVAASVEESDPDAAQALLRASVTVEELIAEAASLRRCLVRVHDTLQRGERDASLNAAVIAAALSEIESGGFA